MQIVINLADEIYEDIKYRYDKNQLRLGAMVLELAILHGEILPKGHGPLIDQYAAIKAVDDRHEYLMRDPIYRKKKGNQIDLIGIKQHIWDITPIVEKDREQK